MSMPGPRTTTYPAVVTSTPADEIGEIRGRAEIKDVLARSAEEAARLLDTDGAMIYLVDPSDGSLHFAHEAGIDGTHARDVVRRIVLPPGTGLFGAAFERRTVLVTDDYPADTSFRHADDPDDVVAALGIRSMVVAPLIAGDDAFGALGTFSRHVHGFTDAQIALIRALADHAAGTIARVRLIDELGRSREELRASEERYRTLVQTMPDVIYRSDAQGRFLFMAEGAEALFGWTSEEIANLTFADLTGPESLEEALRNFEEQRTDRSVHRYRYQIKRRDGETLPAEVTSVAVWEDGKFAGVQGTVRGISEQARLERDLVASEERYRFLVEHSPDLVFATDAEGRFTFMSEALERIAGWRPADVIGQHFSMIIDPALLSPELARWNRLKSNPSEEQITRLGMRRADGSLVPVEISAIGITDADGRFAGIHGSARDVGERSRLERHLRRQAAELAAGAERAHLARELHDSVTQALFSIGLVARSVELLLDRDMDAARTRLGQLRDLQREALAEMRALIFELRPIQLEQDGLVGALRSHASALEGRVGLAVLFETEFDERLPATIEEVVYRIAQEALHNVVKHAAAKEVRLELARVADGVRLIVADDGKGFDPSSVADGHLGLAGMRTRAERIGARFDCRSAPGQGTTIEILVEIDAIAVAEERPEAFDEDAGALRDAL